ncbi:MAG: penicillin-binding protein activator [Maricaulaceae bacterium]
MRGRAAALLCALAGATLAACETTGPVLPGPPGPGAEDQTQQPDDRRAVVDNLMTPVHRANDADRLVRVGLLLPLSAPSPQLRDEALSMLNAAQLAMFETDAQRLVLIPKDTGGTAEGARSQARAVLREGADVILGPVLADSVRAATDEASVYGAPVIAFSNDSSVTEAGAYLLSRTPEEEVCRIVEFSSLQGVVAFAALTPVEDYGYRVRDALEECARESTGFLTTWEEYPSGADATLVDPAARRLARYDERLRMRDLEAEEEFELPYQAIMLPEGGVRLLSVAPLLPFYDVDPRTVRFLGTSLWMDDSVAREPSLIGGWFPGPDPVALEAFESSYVASFGEEPSRLAPLAYDAVLMTSSLTRGLGALGLTDDAIMRPTGFRGADGLFRFNADRLSQHSMAIYEVRGGRFVVVDPAPLSFEPAVF